MEEKKSRSQFMMVLKRLSKNRMAILGLIILLLLIIMGIFADFIAPYGYAEMDWKSPFQHPSAQHWFGTDEFGRDIFSRIVYGARISLLVGFVSVGIAVVVGGTLGAIAGSYGYSSVYPADFAGNRDCGGAWNRTCQPDDCGWRLISSDLCQNRAGVCAYDP